MRLRHAVTTVLVALCCADSVAGRGIWRPERRQDATDTSTATDVASTQSTHPDSTSSTRDSTSTSIESSASSSVPTSAASHTPTAGAAPTSDTPSPVAAAISTSTAASPTATAHSDALPLQPKITPAMGVAGVLLIGAGVVLCLFGARHKEVHIFLSSALLASLAVSVLIVYVMHPPVKDAIQGAYLVAAVVTGLILGSLALVFKDVTEGMGTLLGGFCLAMWFLVLSPGGLVKSTAGKDIMIAVFLVVFFSLSLSHWTRTYGLIGCTAFAGAEVTMLGVDCFSRAGLKEFWLYIWNLNNDEFPLGTNTYPITRGIKVEIACTIILFLFAILSQLRIWETVKQRRARKDAARMQDDERRDQLEAAVGKEIESSNERDRAQWEAVYGDKDRTQVQVDSGVGSSIDSFAKRSTGTTEREVVDDIELASLPPKPAKRSSKHDWRWSKHDERPVVTVRTASEDEPTHPPQPTQSEENLLGKHDLSRTTSYKSVVSDLDDATSVRDWQHRSSAGTAPPVPPMPFTVPGEEKENHEGGSSVSARESVRSAGSLEPENRGLPLTHLSLQNRERAGTPHVEDDANSSVAATADEDVEVDALSADRLARTPSPYQLQLDKDTLGPPRNDERERSRSPRLSMIEVPVVEEDEEVIERPATAREEPQRSASAHNKSRATTTGSLRRSVASKRSAGDSASDDEGDHASAVGQLKDHLPQKLSKAAMTYRTNEWAKHITDADKPDVESELESTSPGIQVDHVFAEEAAEAANVEDLKSAETPQVSRNVSNASNNNPYRRSMQAAPQPPVRSSSGSATPVYAFQRSASLQRQSSNSRLTIQSQRNASAPLMAQTLVESPVEDVEHPSGPYRNFSTPLASSNNLMDERNDRLKRKPTTVSFNALTSTSELNIQAAPDATSVRKSQIDQPDSDHNTASEHQEPHDEENMTLAERKALIQQREHALRPASSHEQITPRQRVLPPPVRVRSMTAAPKKESLIYDSHQPKRTKTVDTVRQSAMMSQWHQSLHAEAARQQPAVDEHAMREQVLAERRQAEQAQQRQQAERVNRESMLDMAMRSGQFHEAHRDAMRRMQAKANRGAPQ